MNIQFSSAGDNNFAMNPQTEKRGDRRLLRMAQRGCTHFLVLASPLNMKLDIQDKALQSKLEALGDALRDARELPLPQQEEITVSCISYMAFRKDNEYIDLPDKAANYAICGCHYRKEDDLFNVLLPTTGMGYHTSVAVEMHYRMKPYEKEVKKLFRKQVERTPFYEVCFEKKNSFIDGSIVYTIGKKPYRFPITQQMLGRTFLIKTDGEIPKFEADNAGVILRQE